MQRRHAGAPAGALAGAPAGAPAGALAEFAGTPDWYDMIVLYSCRIE